jgi:glutathione synthase/RimK-type ligase-like ATP-grasp enzyme
MAIGLVQDMYTKFYPRVRSKNYSISGLRKSAKGLPALPVRSVIRFGSDTPVNKIYPKVNANIVEINTIDAIQNSRSKLRMKDKFAEAGVPQPDWFTYAGDNKFYYQADVDDELVSIEELPFPLVVKRVFGFKGRGMHKFDDLNSFKDWLTTNKTLNHWYIERFHNYNREYRLHCTQERCFYVCRKMLKEDAKDRWYRNDSNCVWILESNENFNKPSNFKDIEADCVKALKAVGLDIGAFDVRVQSDKNDPPRYVLIEVNSAPAFGEITEIKYKEILPDLIINKAKKLNVL